ncbi:ADP-ribosylglycohydrolase family protein [Saccharopolyspora shandongensis]|uniref:ADP-ribosylglycohydrolase family protein n=1 Tax=Saccharopolyspora shandongensis TaxID=418495 RepID=UPI003F4E2933
MSWPQIRQQFGDRGITSYAPTAEQLPSSLLRLALSLDAVIRADRARVAGDEPDLGQALAEAYELAAQRLPAFANDVIAESAAHYPIDPQFASSLALVDNRADEVVRYVPLALWTEVYSRLFQAARGAASTSADAEDASSIAAFVVMLQQCIFTHNPGRGLTTAETLLGELDDSELLALLSRSERIARHGITPEQIEQLGSGDTPAEAIAIAFCAATAASWDFDESLRIAVNHSREQRGHRCVVRRSARKQLRRSARDSRALGGGADRRTHAAPARPGRLRAVRARASGRCRVAAAVSDLACWGNFARRRGSLGHRGLRM